MRLSDRARVERLVDRYLHARNVVCSHGFAGEIEWQTEQQPGQLSESSFLREAAWVVLNAGMREMVIRRLFAPFSDAFLNWSSAAEIVNRRAQCASRALQIFGHHRKVDAVVQIAQEVTRFGPERLPSVSSTDLTRFIATLPFMGPATSRHLAKNLGIDVAKPDRHLLRIARAAGFTDVDSLCGCIATHVPDRVAVVDLVLWRFATFTTDYEACFSAASEPASWP